MQNIFFKIPVLLLLILFAFTNAKSDTYTVTNTDDYYGGPVTLGSFRYAIYQAETHLGKDTVKFQIPGAGPHTIYLINGIDNIVDSIFIDGFSQSGQGVYDIIIDGSTGSPWSYKTAFPFWKTGSSLKPHQSKIEGLIIQTFSYGISITPYGSINGIQITNCKILNTTSAIDLGTNVDNITISGNEIIGNPLGSSTAIIGLIVNNCLVEGNKIKNGFQNGINLEYTTNTNILNNQLDSLSITGIGIIQDVSNVQVKGNTIGCNGDGIVLGFNARLIDISNNNIYAHGGTGSGINIYGTSDSVFVDNNLIGADSTWANKGVGNYGIILTNPDSKNIYLTNNTIVYNSAGGIKINTADSVFVFANYIGTNSLSQQLGNIGYGIKIEPGSSKIKIGNGTASGTNTIAYNSGDGINNLGSIAEFNRNLIYNNTGKQINLGNDGIASSWGNNSKITPTIVDQIYSGGQFTLTLQSESTTKRIEIYQSNNYLNALQFVTDQVTYVSGNTWQTTFPWPNPNELFVLTSTGSGDNTSEVGNYSDMCLIVTNTNNSGYGSLREAVNCANSKTNHANISFAIPAAGPYTIALAGPPLFITNPYGVTIDGQTQITSGVGSGVDQSVNIQGGVLFPQTTCGPSSFLNLTFSNSPFGIFALSDSLTITNNKFSGSSIRVFLNPSIDSNKVSIIGNNFSDAVFAVDGRNINQLYIQNNTINNNMGGNGLNLLGGNNVTIINNDVTTLGGNGFYLKDLKNIQVDNNKVVGNNSGIGIFLLTCEKGNVQSNSIKDISSGITFGDLDTFKFESNVIRNYVLGFETYTTLGSDHVKIINDTLIKGQTYAMYLALGYSEISGCFIDTCQGGIDIFNNQGGIFNSKIFNNEIYHFQQYGIDLGQGYNTDVVNNTIGDGDGVGLSIPRVFDNLIIKNNTIGINKNNSQAPINGMGIRYFHPNIGSPAVVVTDNIIGNIKFTSSDPYVLFINNETGSAIVVANSYYDSITIENNTIGVDQFGNAHPCERNGIQIFALSLNDYRSIRNNQINNTTIAIDLFQASDVLIQNNNFKNAQKGINVRSYNPTFALRNKIIQNSFINVQNKLIDLHLPDVDSVGNNGKLNPDFIHYSPAANELIISGNNAVKKDTVEVYQGLGINADTVAYIGYGVADASGNWQAHIPLSDINLNENFVFLASATDTVGNTSEFKSITNIPLYLCGSALLNTLPTSVSICHLDSTLVDALVQGASSYTWYNNTTGNVIANTKTTYIKNAGDYRVVVQDGFSCSAADTVTLIEKPLPATADFLMSSEGGKGDKIVAIDISQMDPNTLTWDFSNATVTIEDGYNVLVFPDTGYHAVKLISNLNNCYTTVTHYIHIGPQSMLPPGVDKIFPYTIKNVTLSPNPNNGVFNVDAELASQDKINLEILNFMGMQVQKVSGTNTTLNQSFNFDLSGLTPGNYMLRVTSGKDTRIIRFIIQ